MEFTPTTIGILVAIWVVGYLLGLGEAAIKNDNKEKKKGEFSVPIEEGSDGEVTELASLSQNALESEALAIFERISGALKLRLDGEMVEYKSDLTAEQHDRLLKLVVSLRPWLETKKEKDSLAPLPQDAKISTMPASLVQTTIKSGKGDEEKEDAEIYEDDGDGGLGYASLSMVEQINRILQKKLSRSHLDKRGIQLGASVSGSLLIQIGIEEYEWIDEVPEKEVQDIIRESIAEWEKNATPDS